MTEEHGHEHQHRHDHDHDHDDEHGHDHALLVDRLPEGAWRVDPHGSELLFRARVFGMLPVTGVFEEYRGELVVDAGGAVRGELTVETTSINSGWGRRDARLRGASYLDVRRYPQMAFSLERIAPTGSDQLELGGTLRIQDRDVPLSFPVHAIAHGDHLHLEGRVMVDHDLAGLGWPKPSYVGSRLRLETALTLVRA